MTHRRTTLSELHIGSRILYRSKDDWRTAAVARIDEEKVILTVCSPTGRTYKLSRNLKAEIHLANNVPVLKSAHPDVWLDNLTTYDKRW